MKKILNRGDFSFDFRKINRVMRLSLFLIYLSTAIAFSSVSYSQSTKLTLHLENVTVRDVITAIEEQSEFIFFYQDQQIDLDRVISIQVIDKNIESILKNLFKNTSNVYTIRDRQIIIGVSKVLIKTDSTHIEKITDEIEAETKQPRTKEVTGRVVDETGQPLIGVSIVVKGSTLGTITDIDGYFKLDTPLDAQTLSFSYVGMRTQEIDISESTSLYIIMNEETIGMEEVVVVGYGIQRKESVVGAISQATGEQIRESIQGADLGTALRGSLPGLISLQSTGIPGGATYYRDSGMESGNYGMGDPAKLLIRGQNTWNEAQPLVLVDGVERDLININPYEIERISILKDASATAVFGVKGANGVILITTQRGKEGKAEISFDATRTYKSISRVRTLCDSYTALLNQNYAILNEISIQENGWVYMTPYHYLELYRDQTYPDYLPNVNWQDEFTKDYTVDHAINLSARGGTKFVKYFGAISYLHETDILNISERGQGYDPSFNFTRLNWRSNLDFSITKTTKLAANLSGNFLTQRFPGGSRDRAWSNMYDMPPNVFPVRYSDGIYGSKEFAISIDNGVWIYNYSGYDQAKGTDVSTDFVLTQELDFITKGLSTSLKTSFDNKLIIRGPRLTASTVPAKYIQPEIVDAIVPGMTPEEIKALEEDYVTYFAPGLTPTGYDWVMEPITWGGEASDNKSVFRNLYYEYSINYARNFNKHAISGLGLVSRQERAKGSEFMSYREDWVGRATYGYDKKYLLEFNAAYNGSEKLAKKYRFGFFPSFATGWVISNENFFKPVKPVINELKLRYSNGIVGSDMGIARWLYVGSWEIMSSGNDERSYFGPIPAGSYFYRREGVIPNLNIQWEVAHKKDFGVETSFFDNLISINFDYFVENRSKIFLSGVQRPIPSYFGPAPVAANEGAVDVKGWEIESEFKKTFRSGLFIWFSYAWSAAKDKVIMQGDAELLPTYQKLAGFPIDQPRNYLPQGANSVMETWNDVYNTVGGESNSHRLPGDFRILDFNSNGVVNPDDRVPVGYPIRPQYAYSPSIGFSYKSWSANARFYGVYNLAAETKLGESVYTRPFQSMLTTIFPQDIEMRFSPENNVISNATLPQARFSTSSSSFYVPYDRSYFRLQSAEIAYTLNNNLVKRLGVSNFRFKLSGTNLFILSKMFEDLDQLGNSEKSKFRYPVLRRINIGVNVSF